MNYQTFKKHYDDFLATPEPTTAQQITFTFDVCAKLAPSTFTEYCKRYVNERQQKVMYYLYTFTLKDKSLFDKAKSYIESIQNRRENLNIVELSYVVEHEDTNVHFHVMIGSTRAIRTDAFKQYASKYGFIKRSKKISSENIQIVDYMSKENTPIVLIKK